MTTAAEKLKVTGKIKTETAKAILLISDEFEDEETGKFSELWFPLSQVHEIHRTHSVINGTTDSLVISQWIAKQKGLI